MTDVLALVLAGHLIGDWIVQTDWQAANKVRPDRTSIRPSLAGMNGDTLVADGIIRNGVLITRDDLVRSAWRDAVWRSWKANWLHMLGYHVTMMLALAPAARPWLSFRVLVVSWVTHSFIDRRWPVRWLMKHTGSAAFEQTSWGVMAVDQALHLSILALLVAWR